MRYVIISKAVPGNRPHKMYEKTDPRSGKILHIKQKGSPKPKEQTKQKQNVQENQAQYGQNEPQKKQLSKQNIPVNVGDTVTVGGEHVRVISVGEHGLTVQTKTGEKLKVYHGEFQHSGQNTPQQAPQGGSQGQSVPQKGGPQGQPMPGKGGPQGQPVPGKGGLQGQVGEPVQSDAHLSWDFANYIKTLEADQTLVGRLGKVFFDKPVLKDLTRNYGSRPEGAPTGIEMVAKDENGDRIGHIEIHFDKGKREVYIANISVEDKHQKKGFGTAVIDKIIDFSREKGYPKVTLISNGDVGVYAWSMNGFDFDTNDPDGKGELIHEFTNYLRKKYPDEELEPDQFKHPWDIATFKVGEERVGKDWMIGPGHIYQFFAELNLSDPFSLGNTINNKYRELRGVAPSKPVQPQQPQVMQPQGQMQKVQPPAMQKVQPPVQTQMPQQMQKAEPGEPTEPVEEAKPNEEPNDETSGKSHDMNSEVFHDELWPVENELADFIVTQSQQFEKQSALEEEQTQQQIQEQAQADHQQQQIQGQLQKQKQEKQQQQIQEYEQEKQMPQNQIVKPKKSVKEK